MSGRGWSGLGAAAITAALAVVGCLNDSGPIERASFDEMFGAPQKILLATDTSDPVGRVTDLLYWRDRYFVLDAIRRNVKVYRSDGAREAVWGRSGAGPGEFTDPSSMAVVEEELWVLEALGPKVVRYSEAGIYVDQIRVDGVFTGNLRALPGVSAGVAILTARAPGDNPERPTELQIVAGDGSTKSRFGAIDPSEDPKQEPLRTVVMDVLDRCILYGSYDSNLVRVTTLSGDSIGAVRVADGVYQEPDWDVPARTLEELSEWVQRQELLTGLIPLGHGWFIARLTHPVKDAPEYRYALTHWRLGTTAVSEWTPVRLERRGNGGILGSSFTPAGRVELYRVDGPSGVVEGEPCGLAPPRSASFARAKGPHEAA